MPKSLKNLSLFCIALTAPIIFALSASAITYPKPSATTLIVSPASLSHVGGVVSLSSIVRNATSCTFLVKPYIGNVGLTTGCSNGRVIYRFRLLSNTTAASKTFVFSLVVLGSHGYKITIANKLIEFAVPRPPVTTTTLPVTTTTLPPITKTNTIPVAKQPDAFVLDGNYLWVASCIGNTLTEINGTTKQIVRILNDSSFGFSCPDALAFDGTHIWAANKTSDTITDIVASTGKLVQVLASPQILNPIFMTVHGANLWVINSGAILSKKSFLSEFSTSSGTLVKTIIPPQIIPYTFSDPTSLTFAGNNIWLTDAASFNAIELNSITGKYIRKTIQSGSNLSAQGPNCLAYNAGIIYVCGSSNSSVIEFNAFSGAYIRSFKAITPMQIIVRSKYLYIYSPRPKQLVVYSTTGRLIKYIYKSNVSDLAGIIISSGRYIWLANFNGSSVTRFLI